MTKALMQLILICIYSAQVEILNPSALQSQQQKKDTSEKWRSEFKIYFLFFFKVGKDRGWDGILTLTESTHMLSVKWVASFERGCPRK